MKLNRLATGLLFYAGFAAVWQCVVLLKFWPPYVFPGPAQVFQSLVEMARDGSLAHGMGSSMGRLALGYGLSILIGLPLGVVLSRTPWLQNSLGSMLLGLQTLPSICWLPLALIWFGLNEKAILFVVVMGSVLSISMATEGGVRHVAPVLVRAARTMGSQGFSLYFRVVLPAAFPAILSGLKQGWSFAWRSLMSAELLYVTPGLGFLLNTGRELNDASRVLAVIGIIILIGTGVDQLVFAPWERKVRVRFGLE